MYGTSWMHRVQEAFKLLLPRGCRNGFVVVAVLE